MENKILPNLHTKADNFLELLLNVSGEELSCNSNHGVNCIYLIKSNSKARFMLYSLRGSNRSDSVNTKKYGFKNHAS